MCRNCQKKLLEKVNSSTGRRLALRLVSFVLGNCAFHILYSFRSHDLDAMYARDEADSGKNISSLSPSDPKNRNNIILSPSDILLTVMNIGLTFIFPIKNFLYDQFIFVAFAIITQELDLLQKTFECIKHGENSFLKRIPHSSDVIKVTQKEWLGFFYKIRRFVKSHNSVDNYWKSIKFQAQHRGEQNFCTSSDNCNGRQRVEFDFHCIHGG